MFKAFVYFNLHNHQFSIKALEGKHSGRVVAHASELILHKVTCKVSEAGRQRVLRDRRKNVHAGIVGTVTAWTGQTVMTDAQVEQSHGIDPLDKENAEFIIRWGTEVTYNPYLYDSFVDRKLPEHRITGGDMCWMSAPSRSVFIA